MFITKFKMANLVTYMGVVSSVFAIYYAYMYETKWAYICLIISGVCDMLDGMFARRFKRTDEEREIGIQMDSLCDVASFLIVPIAIYISMGLDQWFSFIFYAVYIVCGITRLGYFNVYANEHKGEVLKVYRGLAVTYASLIYPVSLIVIHLLNTYILKPSSMPLYSQTCLIYALHLAIMLSMSLLFMLDIPIPKPGKKGYIFYAVLAIVAIGTIVILF
ncbi:MAG: hypothetical protein E7262_02915 [Lachnospiraceae bacterium]|nr:hypothetical protein [Lachnospiraceae bacterium]